MLRAAIFGLLSAGSMITSFLPISPWEWQKKNPCRAKLIGIPLSLIFGWLSYVSWQSSVSKEDLKPLATKSDINSLAEKLKIPDKIPRFRSDFAVPIIVDISSGLPLAMPASILGGLPDMSRWLVQLGRLKKDVVGQSEFSGIALTSIPTTDTNGLSFDGKLLVDKPDNENEYYLDLIEFAFLREIQGIGSLGNGIMGSEFTNTSRVVMSEKSPLSKFYVVASPKMLRLFPSNRFATAFSKAPFENNYRWFIPSGIRMNSHPGNNERDISIRKPGVFHAEIKMNCIGVTQKTLPPGFLFPDIPIKNVSTRYYSVELSYYFETDIRGNQRLEEYKEWLDIIFNNIKDKYAQQNAT